MDLPSPDPEANRPDLDGPPAPEEGVVASVDLAHRMACATDRHAQPYQTCGELVQWNREHVLAMVQIHNGIGSGYYRRPMFCDRGC